MTTIRLFRFYYNYRNPYWHYELVHFDEENSFLLREKFVFSYFILNSEWKWTLFLMGEESSDLIRMIFVLQTYFSEPFQFSQTWNIKVRLTSLLELECYVHHTRKRNTILYFIFCVCEYRNGARAVATSTNISVRSTNTIRMESDDFSPIKKNIQFHS